MAKRAFLVYGPESAGNRLMTRVLIACGCFGDGQHYQRLNEAPSPLGVDIAWFRSVPYAGGWPDLIRLQDMVKGVGLLSTVLVMARDINAMAQSQVKVGHVSALRVAYRNISRAYREIYYAINQRDTPCTMVSYEALSNPGYLGWLLGRLELELISELEPIENRNGQYYE